jgi:hypothetical protein
MRVRVLIHRPAVCSPARVPDAVGPKENCEFVAGIFSCEFWSQFAETWVSAVQIGKEQGEIGE